MPDGMPINRQWIVVLPDGTVAVDWGEGVAQDLLSGDFVPFDPSNLYHTVQNDELETLKRAGRVSSFDEWVVFVYALPELPRRTLE